MLEKEPNLEFILARDFAEAQHAIKKYNGEFFLALLDLNLPGATGDEIVALATENDIPSVVFTGSFSDELRERIFQMGAIDYLNKDTPHSLNYVIQLVRRLRNNTLWKALVVDDSRLQRAQLTAMLKKYRFEVLEAESGPEALDILDKTSDIRLMITDYNMPGMDGCELTKAVRRNFAPDRLAIIGISGQTSSPLTARFLKHGANDFLIKPFVREEFCCRVSQNMDVLDQIDALREAASRDPLTGLHNRRHFFDMAEALGAQSQRERKEFSVAMIDIDHFKKINDTHGHQVGDAALVLISQLIRTSWRRGGDVVARFGGEEFCVMLHDTDQDTAHHMLDQLRDLIESTPLETRAGPVHMSVSIGLCTAQDIPVNEMVEYADKALYAAKSNGRNQVVVAENCGLDFFNADGPVQAAI